MMPESQHAHSVQEKQIQYSVMHAYSQLFLDNTAQLSGMSHYVAGSKVDSPNF